MSWQSGRMQHLAKVPHGNVSGVQIPHSPLVRDGVAQRKGHVPRGLFAPPVGQTDSRTPDGFS